MTTTNDPSMTHTQLTHTQLQLEWCDSRNLCTIFISCATHSRTKISKHTDLKCARHNTDMSKYGWNILCNKKTIIQLTLTLSILKVMHSIYIYSVHAIWVRNIIVELIFSQQWLLKNQDSNHKSVANSNLSW